MECRPTTKMKVTMLLGFSAWLFGHVGVCAPIGSPFTPVIPPVKVDTTGITNIELANPTVLNDRAVVDELGDVSGELSDPAVLNA